MTDKILLIFAIVLVILAIINIREIYKLYKYRGVELKSNNKLSFVSVPTFINNDGLQLLSLFIKATKVDRYSNNSMDEWNNSFKGFTLHFDDKDPLNIVYLKNIGVNIYDAKTGDIKHRIMIADENDTYDLEKLINMISMAHYLYTERKDEDVWD